MARFRVAWFSKGECYESETVNTIGSAQYVAAQIKAKVITILRDSEGEDHPDNAGKFFLYQIVK